jgi:hypothetical protein
MQSPAQLKITKKKENIAKDAITRTTQNHEKKENTVKFYWFK